MTVHLTNREKVLYLAQAANETILAFFTRTYPTIRGKAPDPELMNAYTYEFHKWGNIPPFIYSYLRLNERRTA